MLEVRNDSPFVATIAPFQDPSGLDCAIVPIKGTFTLGGAEPRIADEQVALCHGDFFFDEPGRSSTRYESDLGPQKPGTDVVLNGAARPPAGRVKELDVTLAVGPLEKTVRVHGDRAYFKHGGGWAVSDAIPFSEMPLRYERAYGGADASVGAEGSHPFDDRNDLGVGFVAPRSNRDLEGTPLPNLEDPRAPLGSARPGVAGFGFIARHWTPRVRYAGTYDERWRRERCPLLPEDFDVRFLHGAHPDLVSSRPLVGGEAVRVSGASPRELAFALPKRRLSVRALIKGVESEHPAALDTVVIEPDERRVLMTWRARIPCGRAFLYIDRVHVRESAT
jgi:hypothetical protein